MVKLIGIAGGTGSGKSTVAYGLLDKHSTIEVVHFDDYQKLQEEVPVHHGMKDWDCLEAINFDSLRKDLQTLKSGKPVTIMTKSRRYNPNYEENGRIRKKFILQPKPIVIVEGYMSLNKTIRDLYDYTIFLDLDQESRLKRRNKVLDSDFKEYLEKILTPAHKQHVEPTKEHADLIINVKDFTEAELIVFVENKLKENHLL